MALKKIAEFTGRRTGSVVKVYRNVEFKEYVAKPTWRTPEADYFTDDKQDALDTAKAMIREHDLMKA